MLDSIVVVDVFLDFYVLYFSEIQWFFFIVFFFGYCLWVVSYKIKNLFIGYFRMFVAIVCFKLRSLSEEVIFVFKFF